MSSQSLRVFSPPPISSTTFSSADWCIIHMESKKVKHRIIEQFGLEGTLKDIQFQPPAMGRDTFH